MSKIFLVGPKTKLDSTIQKLHELEILHIMDHVKSDELDIGTPLQIAEKLSNLLVEVRAYKSHFEIKDKKFKKTEFSIDEIEERIAGIDSRYKKTTEKLKELKTKISALTRVLHNLHILDALGLDADAFIEFKSITCFIGFLKPDKRFESKLDSVTKNYQLYKAKDENRDVIAMFVDLNKKEEVYQLLKSYNFKELDLGNIEVYSGKVKKHINKIREMIKSLTKRKQGLEARLQNLKSKNKNFILSSEAILSRESEKAMAPLRFAQTKESFLIRGWVPTGKLKKIVNELETYTKAKVYVAEDKIQKGDRIPIILKNPKIIKPFEFFMDLYTLPNYKEFDPTTFMFMIFPIFFGYMLGDVGYGLITLLLFYYLKKKMPSGKNLLNAMILCSIFTIVFGFMFGEYFGYENATETVGTALMSMGVPMHAAYHNGHVVFEVPRLVNRMHGEMEVMGFKLHSVLIIGALFGFLHINLGLLIGFFNVLKNHGLIKAILEKFSWFILEGGVVLLALSGLRIISAPSYYGLGILLVSLVMIVAGEGIKGLVELPGIFGNMLSYLRLGAIGLASVGLAVIVNEKLAQPFLHSGNLFSIFIAIIILAFGHAINIGIGILGGFLQTLRLHYVEFFSKFYEGGGLRYSPFGIKR